jgi:hypothetical protein
MAQCYCSTDGEAHEFVTYVGFYGAGFLFVVLVVVLTVVIERRKHRSKPQPGHIQVGQARSRAVRRGPSEAELRELREHMDASLAEFAKDFETMKSRRPTGRTPELSFGRPQLPQAPQPIFLPTPDGEWRRVGEGRVIQV